MPRSFVLGLASLAFLSCCAPLAKLHSDYARLRPTVVDVRPPDNATVRRLEKVEFGGLAQRLITGPREYNVLSLLHQSLRQVMADKGYEVTPGLSRTLHASTDFKRPLSAEAQKVDFDAVLYTTIRSWSVSSSPAQVRMRLAAELYKVPTGERLYEIELPAYFSETRELSQGRFLKPGLRRSAYRALAELPGPDRVAP